ncbi:zinc-binding dehydrogenase [Mesorhizobium sp. BH1-1-4]|uniref:zinc-binding dehydrogenase n=1 Tax=Mesorhizobium sp. BH1-1-4 TaxID=2876662 RepID=UPI001CD126DC|nr:zinc-binding dehydrogenase [Mesorhizobium sp. BH1-1-4]MBZ9994287.1 zinc-binding dehydrogenase [Mesorhizobium sp. BH1-1-4]
MGREIVFTGKRKFELADYDDGPIAPHEVQGRTLVTLVSPGTELAWADGGDFPLRPGYAAVFEAEEIGSAVSGIKPGDRLLCMGAHRSTQKFDTRYVVKLPVGMAPETAVVARLMGVTMTTLMTTTARAGDKVIICGAGPVGYLAAHQCRIAGYEVTLVEPDERRRAQAIRSGIVNTLATMPVGDPEYVGSVALVIDCSGHEQAVLDGCKVVRRRGEVVLVGVPWKANTAILAQEILHAIFFNFVVLRSGWEWEVPLLSRAFVWEELYEGYNNASHSTFTGLAKALKWLSERRIPVDGLVRSLNPIDPAAVYGALLNREIDEPFVVLDWSGAN